MATIYDNLIQKTPSSGGSIPTNQKGTIYDNLLSKNEIPLSKPTIYDKLKADIKPPFYTKITEPVKKYVGDYISSFNDQTAEKIGNAIIHPYKTAEKVTKVFQDAYMGGIEKAGTGFANIVGEKKYTAKTAAGLFDVGTGLINAVFSPITGFFEIAQKIPGAKQVADFVLLPFTVLDKITDYGVGKAIDSIPESIMSQETKDIIKRPLQDFSSSVSAIYFGGKIMKAIEGYTSKGKKITKEDAQNIVDKVQTPDIKTAKERIAHSQSMDIEGAIKSGEMPREKIFRSKNILTPEFAQGRIDDVALKLDSYKPGLGNKFRKMVDINNVEMVNNQPVGLIKIANKLLDSTKPISIGLKVKDIAKEKEISLKTEPIKVGPEIKPTQLVETLKTDAFAKGIEADFGRSPEYITMNMRDQFIKSDNIVKNSPEFARNIIEGKVPPPEGVRLGSVYTAMKLDALERGDVAKILELAKSRANEIASSYGQEVKAFDSQLASDPVKIINSINKERTSVIERRSGKEGIKITEEIKQEIKAKIPTKEDWASFIKSIEC